MVNKVVKNSVFLNREKNFPMYFEIIAEIHLIYLKNNYYFIIYR